MTKPNLEEIKNKLIKLSEEDQKQRKDTSVTLVELRKFEDYLTVELKKIIKELGRWPGLSMVGKEGETAAWLLAQHTQDKEFARYCLQLMEENIDEVTKANYAYLVDKVLLGDDKPQRYGTVVTGKMVDGEFDVVPMPLEDPQKVEQLRVEMGLGSLEKQIAHNKEMFLKYQKKAA